MPLVLLVLSLLMPLVLIALVVLVLDALIVLALLLWGGWHCCDCGYGCYCWYFGVVAALCAVLQLWQMLLQMRLMCIVLPLEWLGCKCYCCWHRRCCGVCGCCVYWCFGC